MLKVIAGEHRGRQLKLPNRETTRPTQQRVKEAFFSMIQFKIPGSIVLDLFAGSGSLGIEALSRGAMKSIFVESNSKASKVIEENLETLRLTNASIIKSEVGSALSRLSGTKYDFIFMDPPYKNIALYNETLEQIASKKLLSKNGLIVLEASRKVEINIPEGLTIQKNRTYGTSQIYLIANNN